MNEPREADDLVEDPGQVQESPVEAAVEAAVAESDEENQELVRLQAEVTQLREEVLRERAEAENVRKRAARDVEAAHKFGQERLINELLPVKDSMDMGLAAASQASDVAALTEGMALTAKMFSDFLDKLNVQALDPTGERFDPEFHQAMTTEESSEVEAGLVLRVMQKGYVLNDRLLRPALVVVARAPAAGDA